MCCRNVRNQEYRRMQFYSVFFSVSLSVQFVRIEMGFAQFAVNDISMFVYRLDFYSPLCEVWTQ